MFQICSHGIFSKGPTKEFETAMGNEPSVFEPLKLYCITLFTYNTMSIYGYQNQSYNGTAMHQELFKDDCLHLFTTHVLPISNVKNTTHDIYILELFVTLHAQNRTISQMCIITFYLFQLNSYLWRIPC